MRLLIQRVKRASVTIQNQKIGAINSGLLVFIGITHTDTKETADYLINKLFKLRIFEDENNKMNFSIRDIKGEILLVSQFTLYANTNEGNRPSFIQAASPEFANELYKYFIDECRKNEIKVETGIFGTDMKVELLNDGPVTIMLEK